MKGKGGVERGSVECREKCSVECEVSSGECGVWSVECEG